MAEEERAALLRVCGDLGLPAGDSYTQDWEFELAEEYRSPSRFQQYLGAYGNPSYGAAERRLLVSLLLDVANDLLGESEREGRAAWGGLEHVLREHFDVHRDQIERWALPGEPLEDAFALTPWVRELWSESRP